MKRRLRLNLLADKETLDLREMCNDSDLRVLQGKEAVERINLSGSPITDEAFQYLSKLPNLTNLELTRTNVTTLRGLDELKKLRFLNLNATKVDDAALDNVVKLKNLEELDLSNTTITDRGVAKLAGLVHLDTLKLGKNRNIGTNSIKVLKSMKNLPHVDLSDTEVSISGIEDLARSNLTLQTIVFSGTTSEIENLESKFPTMIFSPGRQSLLREWENIAHQKSVKGNHAAALEYLEKIVAAIQQRPNSISESGLF